MKCFVLLLIVFITIARTFGVDHNKNVKSLLSERIYGGYTAVRSDFPWQVSVQSSYTPLGPSESLCGGSIISKIYVLTACSCVYKKVRFDIGIGTVNLYFPLYTVYSNISIPHPKCNIKTLQNDIALIKLSSPLSWITNQVQPILLARASVGDLVKERSRISGWGDTPTSSPSYILLFALVYPIPNSMCGTSFGGSLCTLGYSSSTDRACHRDYGGALVYNEKRSDRVAQIGVFSYPLGGSCTGTNPGIYARITYYLSWINSITGIPILP